VERRDEENLGELIELLENTFEAEEIGRSISRNECRISIPMIGDK
jgi:hypothetical protein